MFGVEEYIDKITFAASLRELRDAVVDAYDFLNRHDLGDLDDYVSMSALPIFGGQVPSDTNEIWSWDAEELMVTGPEGGFIVVDREEWGQR
jgi:hypothetical protein